LDGQDDQVGVLDDLLVAAAANAELDRAPPAALMLARADGDVDVKVAEPGCQGTSEGARAADDRDLHPVGTRPRTVSTSACRASGSDMSVRVTSGRTPRSATASASSASASSRT